MLAVGATVTYVAAPQATRDEPLHNDADQLLALVPEQFEGRLVDILDPAVNPDEDDSIRRRGQQRGKGSSGEPRRSHLHNTLVAPGTRVKATMW